MEREVPPRATGRSIPVDLCKAVAICGVLLIHTSAVGGYRGGVGSVPFTAALFWGSLLRCAVPVFFLCSGALLLPPEKSVTVRKVYTKYLPRILAALFFWAAAYQAFDLLLALHRTGVLAPGAIRGAVRDLLLFHHQSHLYYLHIILLVYCALPVTLVFVARAKKQELRYALILWLVLGILLPAVKGIPPLSLMTGIPQQYPMNMTYAAIGYGVLGYYLREYGAERPAKVYAALYLAGFALTFGGTLVLSLRMGRLYEGLLSGMSPGICLEAAGLFGFFTVRFRGKMSCPGAEALSRASFCIYLVHMFFLELFRDHGLSAARFSPVWSVPALSAVLLALGYLTWLLLRRIPVVRTYLI